MQHKEYSYMFNDGVEFNQPLNEWNGFIISYISTNKAQKHNQNFMTHNNH